MRPLRDAGIMLRICAGIITTDNVQGKFRMRCFPNYLELARNIAVSPRRGLYVTGKLGSVSK